MTATRDLDRLPVGGPDLVALRDEVVRAACGWSGALRGRQRHPRSEGAVRIDAEQRRRLLDAINAYLDGDHDEGEATR